MKPLKTRIPDVLYQKPHIKNQKIHPSFPPPAKRSCLIIENRKGMNDADIIDYLNGHASAAERTAMEAWLADSPGNRREFQRVQRLWRGSGAALQPEAPDVDAAWGKVRRRIRRPVRFLPVIGRVAAAVLLLLAGVWAWNVFQPPPQLVARQGAEMATEAFLLPDGSRVWLHKESAIFYPESFTGNKRLVRLSGEAYFEVARDEAHPFLIETDGAAVRVLGTSFGLMAYPDSSTAWVQVNSGRVAFYPVDKESRQVVLEKGEGAQLNKISGQLQRLEPGAANRIAWRTKKLNFQNTTLEEMAATLESTYGVKIIFENAQLASCRFTASFDEEPLESVLQTLNTLFGIRWVQDGQVILLRGEGC